MSEKIQNIDTHVDLLRVLLWQYNHTDSDSIEGLLKSKSEWYELYVSGFWETWFDDVFNIQTANEFGLTVWAIILGVSFEIPDCPSKTLTVEQKRLVIRLRFYQITTRATIPMVNAELADIFGEGVAYALDPLDMSSITYVFNSQPSPDVALVLSKYDLLPRPSGVGVNYRVAKRTEVFGFGTFNQNFNNGSFYNGDQLISYDWDLSLQYDNSTGLVSGVLGSGDASQDLGGYEITLIYTDLLTDTQSSKTVTTASDGSFTDNSTPDEGRWSVVAKLQIDTPICTTIDVQSPVVEFSRIVYKFEMTASYDADSKTVKGKITCNQTVDLSGQTVTLSYAPDAANGEGSDVIGHSVITTSDGTFTDENTPASGRYKVNSACHIVLPVEGVSDDVSAPEFEYTNIVYVYGLSIEFVDADVPYVTGKLTCNHPLPSVSNVSINLYYSEPGGNKNVNRYVRTDSNGVFKDERPPVGLKYKVRASTTIRGPLEEKAQTVVSEQISYQIVYTYGLVIEYTTDGTIKGNIVASGGSGLGNQLVTLNITNTSDNTITSHSFNTDSSGGFEDTNLPGGGTFSAVATCAFKPTYGGTVDLVSNTVGYSSIAAGAQVKMIIANVQQVMCCIRDTEASTLRVDYGDGNGPGTDFRLVEATATANFLAVLPRANFPVNGRTQWTVTFTGTHSVRFCNTTGANKMTFNRLTRLIYVASNSRTDCYILCAYSNLDTIDEGCFAALPNCKSFNTAFARLSYLTKIPDDILKYQAGVEDIYGMFANSKNIRSFPTGMLDAQAESLIAVNSLFSGCTLLEGKVNDVLTKQAPQIGDASNMFLSCSKVTGEGLPLIARMPLVTKNSNLGKAMFKYCTLLDDYSTIPAAYKS